MTFNSLAYFVFLPILFAVYFLVGNSRRWIVLLLGSYLFYGFLLKPALLIVLSLVILGSYYIGGFLSKTEDEARRKQILWIGILGNLSFLIYFKYLPFLVTNLNGLLLHVHPRLSLDVPPPLASVGLSFFVLQAISYLADIYFRMAKPEPHLGYFALYMSFFPKLLQGPIERSNDLLPQLKAAYEFNYDHVRSGLVLFSWGLFKKVVIAERMALYVNLVYSDLHSYSGFPLIVAHYIYAMQIYFDFAGYTDMARGTARIFGINLTENFNGPYLATSVAEFWRRWHMSFSRWILEYIFEPLQMKFRNLEKRGTALALVCTFLIAGLWHDASWCFVIFGFLHGIYLSSAMFYRPYQKKLYKWLGVEKSEWLNVWRVFVTFHLVCFSLIFFRAANLSEATYVVKGIFGENSGLMNLIWQRGGTEMMITVALLVLMAFISCLQRKFNVTSVQNQPLFGRWAIYYALVMGTILLNVDSTNNFIYFMF